jgi:hypothetical protein
MRTGIGLACATTLALVTSLPATAAPAAPAVEKEYKTSWEQFEAFKAVAKGGARMTWAKLPDWTGIWTRVATGIGFDESAPRDPRMPGGYKAFSGVLTPDYQPIYDRFMAEVAKGNEYDQLTDCLPAGFPRWLTTPFLREWVLRPDGLTATTEGMAETRRIYTDGRGHVPDDEAYPLWEGDSIGFWNGDTLVVHTTNIKAGRYTRGQPEFSDQTSTVERIRKLESGEIQDEVWIYDPPILAKPWHVRFNYVKVTDPPNLRINMWACTENNNAVRTPDGATTFILPGEPGYRDPSKRRDAADAGR